MSEILTLIDQLIEQHKVILKSLADTQKVVNDASALFALDGAKKDLMPGRLDDQHKLLEDLEKTLNKVEEGLKTHFNYEETALVRAMKQYASETLVTGLRVLLMEHAELKTRLEESRKEVAELFKFRGHREITEGRVWGMRVYIAHTEKLIGLHANSEEELFHKLRDELANPRKT